MKTGFEKLKNQQLENTYGGWAWLVAAFPFMLQAVVASIAGIKMMFTDNGSVKNAGFEAHWEKNKISPGRVVRDSSMNKVAETYYAY